MNNWEKFVDIYKNLENQSDIILFTFILMHRWCDRNQIVIGCNDLCNVDNLESYVKRGLIIEEEGHYRY